jgi:hypothetical protein
MHFTVKTMVSDQLLEESRDGARISTLGLADPAMIGQFFTD